jgi:single-strand DNA-binding protein
MNVLTATGNLGQDCKTNNVGGTAVVNFSVAMKSGFGDKAQTIWLDCALWGKQAESGLVDYLKKGQQVGVSGDLSLFEADNGKTYLKLRCNSVDLLGGRDESQAAPAPAPAPASAPVTSKTAPLPDNVTHYDTVDDFDDDIPF